MFLVLTQIGGNPMKKSVLLFTTTILTTGLIVNMANSESRHVDAHVHGEGELNIAIEGNEIAMELIAPGFDIIGFEYTPTSDEDKAKVEKAEALLADTLNLFTFPEAAACKVTSANIEMELGEAGREGDHDDHGHGDHDDHDKHDEHEHDDHDKHDEHDVHDEHDEHDHDEHSEEDKDAQHLEFHAEYALSCEDANAVNMITTNYFDTFPNAETLEVQLAKAAGSTTVELDETNTTLNIQ